MSDESAKQTNQVEHIRHTLAHVLAAAVRELYPGAQNAIGPSVENGFYQDFDLGDQTVSDDDLKQIEAKMRELLPRWTDFESRDVTLDEVEAEFAWNEYKMELARELDAEGKQLTFQTAGGFIDLCKGGHVEHPAKDVPAKGFKLDRIAGAYWRGDEKNKMLTRIYGLAFSSKDDLYKYLEQRAEAEKRDHKKLGRELDLFTFSDLVGSGLPLFTPKGTILRGLLDDYVWQIRKEKGFQKVEIPHITKKSLYETSGHWAKFKDDLFKIVSRDGHEYAMKPMNCPHHTQIYARKPHSYRELPQRFANTTMVYRDEQSGELGGLTRVLAITQDDAHVFSRFVQLEQEVGALWDIVDRFYKTFDFTLEVTFSFHDSATPEKYLGDEALWQRMEDQMRSIAKHRGVVAEEIPGEAAFYGPKIDFIAKDAIGRKHQVATIQLDMNMPEGFDLTCNNEQGERERIVMIHAAVMGSIERFLGVYIEHCAGKFPLWLAPVQIKLLPIADRHVEHAQTIADELIKTGYRVELDDRQESVGKKIRAAQLEQVPYMLVFGDKEIESKQVAVRHREEGDLGIMTLEDLVIKLSAEPNPLA